jgi:hypothetical protein
MVHNIVLKFEKILLSGTLIIIRKRKVWRTDERTWESLYTPRLSSSVGDKKDNREKLPT